MSRRDYAILAGFIIVAIASRWLFFDQVGVWGDFGFYTYDAQLILDGQTPFIDFLGRSPLFLYTYAAVTTLTGEFVHTLRWFAVTWYILTAVPLYLLAHRIGDRRVAIATLLFYLATPFSIAYGMRASTQSMALFFSVCGIYAIYRWDSVGAAIASGALIGLGFTARQSVVAVAGGVGLWMLWRAHSDGRAVKSTVGRLTAFSAAWVGAVFLVYWLVMRGDVGSAVELFDQQVVGLLVTDGRGGYPLIGVDFPTLERKQMKRTIPIVHDLFPQLNTRGARVFASTLTAASPAIGMFAYYARDGLERLYAERGLQYLGGIMLALALYAIAVSLWMGYYHRAGIVVGLGLLTAFAWAGPPVDTDALYSRGAVLLLFVCVGLAAGYLMRDRLIANYYFLDFWPFVSVLAGLVAATVWRMVDDARRYAFVGIVGLLVLTSVAAAHPLASTMLDEQNSNEFTMEKMADYRADIDARTERGEVVFTAHPTYLSGTHSRMPMDDPRLHYRYATWATANGTQWPAEKMYDHIGPRLERGDYEWLILDTMTARVLEYGIYHGLYSADALGRYCRVAAVDELYAETGGVLYRYAPDACASGERLSYADLLASAEV